MGGERTAILSHPAGCFFLLLLPLYRLLDRLSMVTVGKIFARQGEIHLCFRLQLKITDLMFNLNINKKNSPPADISACGGLCFFCSFFHFHYFKKSLLLSCSRKEYPFRFRFAAFMATRLISAFIALAISSALKPSCI